MGCFVTQSITSINLAKIKIQKTYNQTNQSNLILKETENPHNPNIVSTEKIFKNPEIIKANIRKHNVVMTDKKLEEDDIIFIKNVLKGHFLFKDNYYMIMYNKFLI
jgi:hypothetical protein